VLTYELILFDNHIAEFCRPEADIDRSFDRSKSGLSEILKEYALIFGLVAPQPTVATVANPSAPANK